MGEPALIRRFDNQHAQSFGRSAALLMGDEPAGRLAGPRIVSAQSEVPRNHDHYHD